MVLLTLLFLLLAAAQQSHPPCNEAAGASGAEALCRSPGLSDAPLCTLADGRLVQFMRSEFGFEFTHALPSAYALFRRGLLAASCGCGNGTATLYTFSPSHWDSPDCVRRWKKREAEELGWVAAPVLGRAVGAFHNGAPPLAWEPPPLRDAYRRLPLSLPAGWNASAPFVFVYNKRKFEWGAPPANTLPLATLQRLASTLAARGLSLVYSRARGFRDSQDAAATAAAAAAEAEADRDEDFDWLASLPSHGVSSCLLDDIVSLNAPGLSYNQVQFALLSRAAAAVSVQGGTSIMAGYFVRDLLVLHARGHELDFGYNEYESLFSRFLASRYRLAFDAPSLADAADAAAPRWAGPRLPPGLPAAAAAAPQAVCTSFHFALPTLTRLGDRLLDSLVVMALARLASPAAPCAITLLPSDYDLGAVDWGACSVTHASAAAAAARAAPPGECTFSMRSLAAHPLLKGKAERLRNCGACGGTHTPARLAAAPAALRLLPPALRSIEELSISFLRAVGGLRLAPGARAEAVAALRRAHPARLIGLHLRRTDKVREYARRNEWQDLVVMSEKESESYLVKALAFVRRQPPPRLVYLATDDIGNFSTYAARVREVGGTVVNAGTSDPWLDLFSLAECDSVVMASRYSTFATVASLLRRRPLVHFTPLNKTLLQIWAPLLVLPAQTPGLRRQMVGEPSSSPDVAPPWAETRWKPQLEDYI